VCCPGVESRPTKFKHIYAMNDTMPTLMSKLAENPTNEPIQNEGTRRTLNTTGQINAQMILVDIDGGALNNFRVSRNTKRLTGRRIPIPRDANRRFIEAHCHVLRRFFQ